MCHEDVLLAHCSDALPIPCSARLSTKRLWAAVSCQLRDCTTAQSFLIYVAHSTLIPFSPPRSVFGQPLSLPRGHTSPSSFSGVAAPILCRFPQAELGVLSYSHCWSGEKLEEKRGADFATWHRTTMGWAESLW